MRQRFSTSNCKCCVGRSCSSCLEQAPCMLVSTRKARQIHSGPWATIPQPRTRQSTVEAGACEATTQPLPNAIAPTPARIALQAFWVFGQSGRRSSRSGSPSRPQKKLLLAARPNKAGDTVQRMVHPSASSPHICRRHASNATSEFQKHRSKMDRKPVLR